MIVDNMNFMF